MWVGWVERSETQQERVTQTRFEVLDAGPITLCGRAADAVGLRRAQPRLRFQSVVAVLFLAGCASAPERVLSDKAPAYATLTNGFEPLNPTQLSALYAEAMSNPGENVTQ